MEFDELPNRVMRMRGEAGSDVVSCVEVGRSVNSGRGRRNRRLGRTGPCKKQDPTPGPLKSGVVEDFIKGFSPSRGDILAHASENALKACSRL